MRVPLNSLTSHDATQSSPLAKLKPCVFNPKMRNKKKKQKLNTTTGNSPQRHLKTIATAVVRHCKFPSDTHLLKQWLFLWWMVETKRTNEGKWYLILTLFGELYDCSLLSMWSKAASVLVGMWSQLPTDTVTQDSSCCSSIVKNTPILMHDLRSIA